VGGTHTRALTPPCDRCGSEAVRPGTAWERFRHWVDDGAGGGSAWRCTGCAAAWSGGSGYAVLYHGGPRPTWRVRVTLLDAVREERYWQPVPRFYAGVGVVALVPSALVAAITPVRWGTALVLGPAAAVAGAFVLSLTSVPGHAAREALARAWSPQDIIGRDHERELARLRAQVDRFPLLVPEDWDGEVVVAGSGWRVPRRGQPELTQVVVVADRGDPVDLAGPRVEVRLSDDPTDTDEQLAGTVRRVTVTVDGAPVEVGFVAGRRTQAAVGRLDGRTVHVPGHDVAVEGIALRRVDDPSPLLDAYDRRQRTLLGLTDGDQETT
jgi:hypothetical protein